MTPDELLADVLARYEGSPEPRLREVAEAGKRCDVSRQELILLSDTLGLPTLVELLTHAGAAGTTENTVLGPFSVPGSPWREHGESMLADDDPGERVVVRGRVSDAGGTPVSGAVLDAWHVFDAESAYLADDAVFGGQPSLVRPFERDESGELAARFDVGLDRAS